MGAPVDEKLFSNTQPQPTVPPLPAADLPAEALELAKKLFDYARSGDTDALRKYLAAGIPPNLTNHEGNTLLMLASYNGQPDTAAFLLEQKADTNVLNGRGQSPLAGAVFKGYDDIVRLLVAAGADVRLGQPNAVECAKMFKRDEALKIMNVEE